jgi:triacylglycerol lipase
MRRLITGAALTAVLVLAPAAGAEDHPVPWTGDFSQQAESPDSPPAGSNDFSCEPSKRHPHPVVLVHGLAANKTVNWSTMSPFLANRGFCVFALTYGTRDSVNLPGYQPGGMLRMQESAKQLKRFVGRVLDTTGAAKVDIVGHSQGSLMPNYYVKFMGGDRRVDDYVGVTPLWDGTNLAGLASLDTIAQALGIEGFAYDAFEPYCASCPQFLASSKFMAKMNSGGGPRVPGVDYTMIMTKNDELVSPWQSGYMDGATNLVVQDQCALDQSEHLSIIYDPITAYDIFNALEPQSRQREVPCVPVLPFIGAAGYSGD